MRLVCSQNIAGKNYRKEQKMKDIIDQKGMRKEVRLRGSEIHTQREKKRQKETERQKE